MNPHKYQSGIAHLAILLVVVFLAFVGFAGTRVYQQQSKKQSPPQTSRSESQDTSEKKEEIRPMIPGGFVEYNNEVLGFSLAYPQEWGGAQEINHINDEDPNGKGRYFSLKFPNMPGSDDTESVGFTVYPISEIGSKTVNFYLQKDGAEKAKEITDPQEIKINGYRAAKFEWRTQGDPSSDYYPDWHTGTVLATTKYQFYISHSFPYQKSPTKYIDHYNLFVESLTVKD